MNNNNLKLYNLNFQRIYILFLCIFFVNNIQAITRNFVRIDSNNGLSQSEVYSFLKDSRGCMWIGTLDGLNCYDGNGIEIFNVNKNNKNTIPNNTIRSLCEDANKRIWIGTDCGLCYYSIKEEKIYQITIAESIDNELIESLKFRDDILWIGTTKGLYSIDVSLEEKDNVVESFKTYNNIFTNTSPSVLDLSFDYNVNNEKILWLINYNILYKLLITNNNDIIVLKKLTYQNYNFSKFVQDKEGTIWIATTNKGLLKYNEKDNHFINITNDEANESSLSSDNCSAIAVDQLGNIWVTTLDRGISVLEEKEKNKENPKFERIKSSSLYDDSLSSNMLFSIYVTDDNVIWIGTIGSGLNIYYERAQPFIHYKIQLPQTMEYEKTPNFIRSVYVDKRNDIWVGTHNNGLFLFDRKTAKFKFKGFNQTSIFHILEVKKNEFLIGTSIGLYFVKINNSGDIISSNLIISNTIFYTTYSKDNIYWIGTYFGLIRLRKEGDRFIQTNTFNTNSKLELSTNNCRVLYYDNEFNQLFIGTEGGGLNVLKLNKDQEAEDIEIFKKSTDSLSISNNYIRDIIKDSEGNIWLGTFEGLNLLTRTNKGEILKFKNFTKHNGLPNNMIQFIEEDNDNNLWLGTNKGMSKFNLENYSCINYNKNNGLQSNEFSEHTSFKTQEGEIIVGGINGINIFTPKNIFKSLLIPQITLTKLSVDDQIIEPNVKLGKDVILTKSISLTDSIALAASRNDIKLSFSSMSYLNPSNVIYSYILQGFDTEWKTANSTNNVAIYTNLPYGKYIFKVKSTNEEGLLSNNVRQLYIHIKTPFYLSVLAYIIYLILLLIIIYGFSKYTAISITAKEKIILENEHNKKLIDLDNLKARFFINVSHDLITPLTLIYSPLEDAIKTWNLDDEYKDKLKVVKKSVQHLKYLIEQMLDFRKADFGKLKINNVSTNIHDFVENEIECFGYLAVKQNLDLNFEDYTTVDSVNIDPDKLAKILFNLISNSLKHTKEGSITVTMSELYKTDAYKNERFYIKIMVEDTGEGVSEEFLPHIFERFNNRGKGYGIGLSHCKDLVEAQGGKIQVESILGESFKVTIFIPGDLESSKEENEQFILSESIPIDMLEDNDIKSEQFFNAKEGSNNKKAKILLIEDNEDMINYLKSGLKSKFEVITAIDGIDGLSTAKKENPDLIISDVMMPNMDGIELCKRIKSDINISHVPIVMLTASTDDNMEFQSLEYGADAYLRKPFILSHLILQVANILSTRASMQKLRESGDILKPSLVHITSVDDKFIKKLMDNINANISNADYSVSELEKELNMSHANFYRKIKNLTGVSGQQLLFNMRMKRAYQILVDTPNIRSSEVAYMVGFLDPKYFSKCFKKKYNILPSEINSKK